MTPIGAALATREVMRAIANYNATPSPATHRAVAQLVGRLAILTSPQSKTALRARGLA